MFLVNLGSFWILSFVFCLSFLLCFWVASARFSGISVFVGPCFLKINFVQHWQSLSAAQNYSSKIQALDFSTLFLLTKIKWKNRGPGTEENTRNTQKQARKTTGKTEKAEKEEATMTPNCQETSKTVQLYLCEVSPNKYVWNPPYYRETKFILLKNIAKRRLPTPLRI